MEFGLPRRCPIEDKQSRMKSPVRDSIEAESAALQREGKAIFVLVCLVLVVLAVCALGLQLDWFD